MSATGTRSWVSVHLFYDGDLDLVITDLVAEAAVRLAAAEAAAGLFFLRYWDGGPHLRIRALPSAGRDRDTHRILAEVARGFLNRRPAPALLDQRTYAELAPVFAAAEGMTDHERVRRPNNSLAFISYRPETHKYGTGTCLHRVEDHFVTCSDLVRRLLSAGVSARQRSTAAFAVLALSWWIGRAHGGRPPAADRRQLEPDAGLASALAERYDRQRTRLLTIVDRMGTLATAPRERLSGDLGTWARSLRRVADHFPEPAALWQVLDNCAHLACNRLGIAPWAESELRHFRHRAFAEFAPQGRAS